jgi:molybdenum cofactor cytidylyltransferase
MAPTVGSGLGAAVVLAAGGGSRFAGPTHKLLAPFRGRTVCAWAIAHAVAAGLDEVIVVEGAVALRSTLDAVITLAAAGAPVRLVSNPRWAEGQASSLQVGIAAARSAGHAAVVVGLGDQPLLDPAAWRAVAATTITPIAAAMVGGRPAQPIRLAAEVWPFLPHDGDAGARSVIASNRFPVAALTCPGTPVDIDTEEDLHQWS